MTATSNTARIVNSSRELFPCTSNTVVLSTTAGSSCTSNAVRLSTAARSFFLGTPMCYMLSLPCDSLVCGRLDSPCSTFKLAVELLQTSVRLPTAHHLPALHLRGALVFHALWRPPLNCMAPLLALFVSVEGVAKRAEGGKRAQGSHQGCGDPRLPPPPGFTASPLVCEWINETSKLAAWGPRERRWNAVKCAAVAESTP